MQLGEQQSLTLDDHEVLFRKDQAGYRWFELGWLVEFLQMREKALLQEIDSTQIYTDGHGDHVSETGVRKFFLQNTKPEWAEFAKQFLELYGDVLPLPKVKSPKSLPAPKEPTANRNFRDQIAGGPNVEQFHEASYRKQSLRYFFEGGSAWFFARDVCAILGFANAWRTMAERVPTDKLIKRSIPSAKINNRALFVHEHGVLPLSERSRLANVDAFRDWFSNTLIPKIHGKKPSTPRKQKEEPTPMPHLETSTMDTIKLFEEAEGLFYVFLRKGIAKEQAIEAALSALRGKLSIDVEVFRQLLENTDVGKGVIRPVKA